MESKPNFHFRLHTRSIALYIQNKCHGLTIEGNFDLSTSSNSKLKAYGDFKGTDGALKRLDLGDLCPMPCDDQNGLDSPQQ